MTSSWQKACICRRKWTISDWTMREWCQSLCRSSCTIRFSRVEMGSADLRGSRSNSREPDVTLIHPCVKAVSTLFKRQR